MIPHTDHRDALRATYDRIAQEWHTDHRHDTWWRDGTDFFVSLLPQGGRVLDVGCAGGVKSAYLAAKGLVVTGIDNAPAFIAIARQEVPQGDFRILDLYDMDTLPAEAYDGVFLQAVLLHVPKRNVRQVIESCTRRLRPGGYLYVTVKRARPGQHEEDIVTEHDYAAPYERFFSFFADGEVDAVMRDCGLAVTSTTTIHQSDTRWIHAIGHKLTLL